MTCGDYIIHIDNAEDGDKFRIIYQRYSRLMIYCAKKIVNDHHIAEDITQQAFMKVIPRLKTISLEEPEKTKPSYYHNRENGNRLLSKGNEKSKFHQFERY